MNKSITNIIVNQSDRPPLHDTATRYHIEHSVDGRL